MSGGFFYAVASYIIREKQGAVYGCCLRSDYEVAHVRVTDHEGLAMLQGSKYTQSYIDDTLYQKVIDDVKNGFWVVFSGTACQIDKLKTMLDMKKLDQSQIILVDIICHGVPSVSLWNDYKTYLQHSLKGLELVAFRFREKVFGWSKYWESYVVRFSLLGKKHGLSFKLYSVLYAKLYGSALFLRESCFQCKYTNVNRPSDFTMGDFWKWKNDSLHFDNDDKGISLVLLNTEKAVQVFECFKKDFVYEDCTNTDYLQMNLRTPTPKPQNYDQAQEDYKTMGFVKFAEKYGFNTKKRKINRFLRNILFKIQGY